MLRKLEYNADVIRGWPYDGAVESVETIKAGTNLVNGDWVVKQSDNTVDKAAGTPTKVNNAGLVIRGNYDTGNTNNSGGYTNKAVVLWGNFIVRIKNLPTGVTWAPGDAVTIMRSAAGNEYVAKATGADPVIGYVTEVYAAAANQDAHIVVHVR